MTAEFMCCIRTYKKSEMIRWTVGLQWNNDAKLPVKNSPKSPSMIGRLTIHDITLSTRDAAYWTVPAVANTPVQVTCVKTLEALVQWHESLQPFHTLGFILLAHFPTRFGLPFGYCYGSTSCKPGALPVAQPTAVKSQTHRCLQRQIIASLTFADIIFVYALKSNHTP